MYLKRHFDKFLNEWKQNADKKPLIVRGARQVGKTETISRFGNSQYESFIKINLVEEPKYKNIVEDGYDVNSIKKNISLLNPNFKFIPGKTLIFFDEIQEFPDLTTSLKFFKIDGRFDVICSGSLLGINYNQITSHSVGYKMDYELISLDFTEFLWARGYDDMFIDDIVEHMISENPFGEIEKTTFEGLFMDYIILGGMPEIVKYYIENMSFEGYRDKQRQIIFDYKGDIRKYSFGLDQARITNVYESVPVQLSKENKKFQLSKIKSGARYKDYMSCIQWLQDAGVIKMCYCLNSAELPLKGNYDYRKFKVYTTDTGLLVSMLDDEASDDIRINKNLNIYKGGLYENIAAEALLKQGYDLLYYKREDSTLEVDFLIRQGDNLVPIEVKAGNARAKSLRTLIQSGKYADIKYGIKFISGNIGYSDGVYTLPLFCLPFLKRYMERK